MKAIVLCAGYATRLYPLTLNKPKPLLEVKGRPLLDYIIDNIEKIADINEIFIATNNKFFNDFSKWKNSRTFRKKIFIVNNMTLPCRIIDIC